MLPQQNYVTQSWQIRVQPPLNSIYAWCRLWIRLLYGGTEESRDKHLREKLTTNLVMKHDFPTPPSPITISFSTILWAYQTYLWHPLQKALFPYSLFKHSPLHFKSLNSHCIMSLPLPMRSATSKNSGKQPTMPQSANRMVTWKKRDEWWAEWPHVATADKARRAGAYLLHLRFMSTVNYVGHPCRVSLKWKLEMSNLFT